MITAVGLFDEYQGKGIADDKKSLAIWVTLQPQAATLTDDDIAAVSDKIVAAAAKNCDAVLRG